MLTQAAINDLLSEKALFHKTEKDLFLKFDVIEVITKPAGVTVNFFYKGLYVCTHKAIASLVPGGAIDITGTIGLIKVDIVAG